MDEQKLNNTNEHKPNRNYTLQITKMYTIQMEQIKCCNV